MADTVTVAYKRYRADGGDLHKHLGSRQPGLEAAALCVADHLCHSVGRIGRLELEPRLCPEHLALDRVVEHRAGHPEARRHVHRHAGDADPEHVPVQGHLGHQSPTRRLRQVISSDLIARRA